MRKRMALMLLGCAMLWGCCADVRAQIGFAEVNSPRGALVPCDDQPWKEYGVRVDQKRCAALFG